MAFWQSIKLKERVGRSAGRAVDLILPPQNLLALEQDKETQKLWQDIRFLDEPCCEACGFPFDYAAQALDLCLRCSNYRPAFHRARAAMVYDDASRDLILSFKHGGRTDGLRLFTAQMARAGRNLLKEADVIMPVPLHPTRLRRRRYNQATLLGRALSKHSGIPFNADSLFRQKRTDTQGGKSAAGRRRNVRGAFTVPKERRESIKGQRIILIDDVMTTGATLEACAKALNSAGAAQVDALCLARVVRAAKLPT